MSGIYGFWQPFNGIKQYNKDINRLKLWNRAYGDAAEETYEKEDFCVGCFCEKLSDTANRSNPVLKKNGKFAVIDALVYNRDELIEKGQFTEELSDEELIFSYIEKFGFEGLKDVNGDFSGAVYDSSDKTFTLFRDHMGVRPLFYYIGEDNLVFSTDVRGIVSMQQVDVSINEKWLKGNVIRNSLVLGTEGTEFEKIFCVKPASFIKFVLKDKKVQATTKTYWKIGSKKIRLDSEKAYIDGLRALIKDSVKRRLDAVSGIVGAELSGGLDSSVIDILINRFGREGLYFSWSSSPEDIPYVEMDERYIIEDICKQENIICYYGRRIFDFEDNSPITQKLKIIGFKADMAEGVQVRYALPPYINTIRIGEASQYVAGQGVKVMFTGHGGDEGVSHRCNPYELFCHGEYFNYLRYMWTTTHGKKHRIYDTIKKCYKNLTKTRKELLKPFESVFAVRDILKEEFREKYKYEKELPLTFAYDVISYIENGGSRNRLEVVALLGAYCGARYVVPYMDYRVIDYAVSIPRHMYLKNNENRYVFREAFKDIMPASLYKLKSKEDVSRRNQKKEEPTAEERLMEKRRLANMLDKEYWDAYLDWNVIEQWVNQSKEQVKEEWDVGMEMCVCECVSLQEMVKRAREV